MQAVPIGIQDFAKLRRKNYLYVDKTAKLEKMILDGSVYFLARPRRFGKSLTLSTLEAMFRGQAELFKGLSAEQWVRECAQHPFPVLSFDLSTVNSKSALTVEKSLQEKIRRLAKAYALTLSSETIEERFSELIEGIYASFGYVVVLIDEYDKPILDNILALNTAREIREVLRSFYIVLKNCDKYIEFVFLTGITRFTKTGVFSSLNNLEDISEIEQYADLLGYTQEELEENFAEWIRTAAEEKGLLPVSFLDRMKRQYDGFSFDGKTRVYNPFSIMLCLKQGRFDNYWYDSGSPSFIVQYMREHGIEKPELYEHIEVPDHFTRIHEIEEASPESFLFQAGYLTIEEKKEKTLRLTYPNLEVCESISSIYLEIVYKIDKYRSIGSGIWRGLIEGNLERVVELFNIALSSIPYDDFPKHDESWYRSLFLMLLRGAGLDVLAEVHGNVGRSDVLIFLKNLVYVLEFKCADTAKDVAAVRRQALKQIEEKKYAKPYLELRTCIQQAIVIDCAAKKALL